MARQRSDVDRVGVDRFGVLGESAVEVVVRVSAVFVDLRFSLAVLIITAIVGRLVGVLVLILVTVVSTAIALLTAVANTVDDDAEDIGFQVGQDVAGSSADGRPFFDTRMVMRTPSTCVATTDGSDTASSGGVSMRIRSNLSRSVSSTSRKRGEVSSSAGLLGRGPQGKSDRFGTGVD